MSDLHLYRIPEGNVPSLRAKVAALARRAEKLGVSAPSLIEEGYEDVPVRCPVTGSTLRYTRLVLFSMDVPEVRLAGWALAATIDHCVDTGSVPLNIIRTNPTWTGTLPVAYRTDKATCDHCRTRRSRTSTFVLQHEDGRMARVGRQCVGDFLGHDAEQLLRQASWVTELRGHCEENEGGFGRDPSRFDLRDLLVYAANALRSYGWLSRSKHREAGSPTGTLPTADWAFKWTTWRGPETRTKPAPPDPTDDDRALADEALDWARGLPVDTESDYLHNVRAVCSGGTVTEREAGIAASAVNGVLREKEQARLRAREELPSLFVGKVGDRFGGAKKGSPPPFSVMLLGVHDLGGEFGTRLVRMQTPEGNLVNWFASASANVPAVGKDALLSGTVKEHRMNKRQKQETTMTRCSLELVVSEG